MVLHEELDRLVEEIQDSGPLLVALGNETRQHLIQVMLQEMRPEGLRINEIAQAANLSRPAAFRHLKILKTVGIIASRPEGAKTYYYFDTTMKPFEQLMPLLGHAREIRSYIVEREKQKDGEDT